jgi:protein SCO1/2
MMRWPLLFLLVAARLAASAEATTDPLSSLAYDERPGARVPMELTFKDAEGRLRSLGTALNGLPLILVPAYFNCPNLCDVVRASLFSALRRAGLRAGRDYTVAVLSIDPKETIADANRAKSQDLAAFSPPGSSDRLAYWIGSPESVHAVTDAVGFRARLDGRSGQYIHPAGIVFLTSNGVVSSYLLGVGYTPAQIRSALERATAGRIAPKASPLLLLCFHFDEITGRYSLEVLKLIRLCAVLTILAVATIVFLLARRERMNGTKGRAK